MARPKKTESAKTTVTEATTKKSPLLLRKQHEFERLSVLVCSMAEWSGQLTC